MRRLRPHAHTLYPHLDGRRGGSGRGGAQALDAGDGRRRRGRRRCRRLRCQRRPGRGGHAAGGEYRRHCRGRHSQVCRVRAEAFVCTRWGSSVKVECGGWGVGSVRVVLCEGARTSPPRPRLQSTHSLYSHRKLRPRMENVSPCASGRDVASGLPCRTVGWVLLRLVSQTTCGGGGGERAIGSGAALCEASTWRIARCHRIHHAGRRVHRPPGATHLATVKVQPRVEPRHLRDADADVDADLAAQRDHAGQQQAAALDTIGQDDDDVTHGRLRGRLCRRAGVHRGAESRRRLPRGEQRHGRSTGAGARTAAVREMKAMLTAKRQGELHVYEDGGHGGLVFRHLAGAQTAGARGKANGCQPLRLAPPLAPVSTRARVDAANQ
jgi:hypothetical protein